MPTFTSLLVATDFSVDGNNAVRRAALLAHEHGARLHILHVLKAAGCKPLHNWLSPTIDINLKAAQARSALRCLAIETSGAYDLTPSLEVVIGDPFATLMRASQRAELVILGRRGHGRLQGLLVGRMVDRMLRTCPRSILVVKTPVEQSYRRVLVPIDFTASSDAAIRVAARMQGEAGLHVFHAIDSQLQAVLRDADVPEHIVKETRMMEEAGTNARMRRKVARLGLSNTPMSFALTYGPPVRATLHQAQVLAADLIIVGKQGRSTVGGFLLGSVSSRVLFRSVCDMLIVPRPRDEYSPHAASTLAPWVEPQAGPDNATLSRGAAAHSGALTPVHWTHNTARFVPRRDS